MVNIIIYFLVNKKYHLVIFHLIYYKDAQQAVNVCKNNNNCIGITGIVGSNSYLPVNSIKYTGNKFSFIPQLDFFKFYIKLISFKLNFFLLFKKYRYPFGNSNGLVLVECILLS